MDKAIIREKEYNKIDCINTTEWSRLPRILFYIVFVANKSGDLKVILFEQHLIA